MYYFSPMFIRVKTSPNSPRKAVQIVESIRQGNRVRQRIVRHVGTALNDDELKRMRELAEHIKAGMEQGSQPGLFPPEQMAELAIQARNRQTDEPLPVDLKKLLVTEHGLPIGYEVFPGSQYEGHTLVHALNKIEKDYKVNDIVFVADSAMLNEDNLQLLESMGKRYVVGARLRNMSEKNQDKILDKKTYNILSKPDDEYEYSMKEIAVNGRRLIVSYNEKNAKKDAYDREKSIERLMAKLKKNGTKPTDLISNFGYKKFLQLQGEATVEINQQKIEREKQWDGIHGVMTNHPDLTTEQITRQYHGLWQVEQCFRVSKHDLKIRPIFHWTPQKIKAHIAICFMALTCARHLYYRIKTQYTSLSEQRIRQLLLSVQISILKHQQSKTLYGVPSSIRQDVKKIYQIMGLKISDVPFKIN